MFFLIYKKNHPYPSYNTLYQEIKIQYDDMEKCSLKISKYFIKTNMPYKAYITRFPIRLYTILQFFQFIDNVPVAFQI